MLPTSRRAPDERARSFDHERLQVYALALDFVEWAEHVIERLRTRPHLADQLHRAATSIALNVAEGAGEFSAAEKARFYRIARRSATECAAVIDVLVRVRALDRACAAEGHEHLRHVIPLLIVMSRNREKEAK